MTSRSRLSALPAWALFSVFFFAPAARADGITKQQCVEADTQAQQFRRDGKLGAARAQLKLCIDAACPALVKDDCAQRLDELDKVQPTIVFEVKDAQGRDLAAVKVTMDGQSLVDNVAGPAIPVEPGAHTFTFETKGEKPLTRQFVLREGDKARHEPIVFGSGVTVLAAPVAGTSRGSGLRTGAILVGGLGVVGLGLGGLFGALAASKWSTAHNDCPSSPQCTPSDNIAATSERTNALTLATVSTVGFIAGGALLASGVVLFVVAPGGSEGHPTQGLDPKAQDVGALPARRLEVVPSGGPGSGGLMLRGWF